MGQIVELGVPFQGGYRDYVGFRVYGFPKIRGTAFGGPIMRTIVYWGLYWGTLTLGNYHTTRVPKPNSKLKK